MMKQHRTKITISPMNLSILDGLFGAFSNNLANFTTPLLLGLGATNRHISLLAAFQSLTGNVLQIPFARLTERLGKRKLVCVAAGVASRLLWLMLIFVPMFWRGIQAVWAAMAILVGQAACTALNTPAWTSFIGDIVPEDTRGRFFARRNMIINLASLISVAWAGRLIEAGGFPNGYRWAILVSLALGLFALGFFLMIPEPHYQQGQNRSLQETSRRLMHWRQVLPIITGTQFGRFVFITALFSLGMGMSSPFFNIYALENLGATPRHLGYYAASSTACMILSQSLWGQLNDRKGARFVLRFCAFGFTLSPLIWIYSTGPWHPLIGEGVSGLIWAGWNLASFNLLLELTPSDRRPTYVALNSFVNGLVLFIAPLLGGAIVQHFGITAVFMVTIVFRLAVGESFRRLLTVGSAVPLFSQAVGSGQKSA